MNIPGLDKPIQPLHCALWRRLRAGRVASAHQPDASRPACASTCRCSRTPAYHNAERQRADVPRRDRRRRCSTTAARCRARRSCGRRASASTRTSTAIRRRRSAAARASSPASRSTSGSRTSSATPACCRAACSRTPATTDAFPFSTNVDKYKPTNVTGAPAASYELNVTDNDFQFPQVWRSNIAVDRRLPGGMTGTAEFIYNRDVNGIYYINANLPAAQSAFTAPTLAPLGRHRVRHRHVGLRQPHQQRGRQPGHREHRAEEPGHRPQSGTSRSRQPKPMWHGLSLRTAYSYGEAKNTIDPGSTATRVVEQQPHSGRSEQPGPRLLVGFAGPPLLPVGVGTRKRYFSFGATTVSAFWEIAHASATRSYMFAGRRERRHRRQQRPDLHPARHQRR